MAMTVETLSPSERYAFAEKLGKDWKALAHVLNLPDECVEVVEYNNPGTQPSAVIERAYQIVVLWEQQRGQAAYLKELEDSLHSLRQRLSFRVEIPAHILDGPLYGVVGRSTELQKLLTHFHPPTAPRSYKVAMLHGVGGIGKSEVAKEYIREFRSLYPDGIFYFYACTPLTFLRSLRLVLISLRVQPFDTVRENWESFKLIIKERRECLLFYDSADILEVIGEYLPAPNTSVVHVLITSRSSNKPQGWRAQPTMFEVEHLSSEASIDLLLKHSGLKYDFSQPHLDEIVSREYANASALVGRNMIGGYMLALICAGKHIGKCRITIEDYVRKLKQRSQKIRVKITNLSEFLHYFKLKDLEDERDFMVESLEDVCSLDIERLNVSEKLRARLRRGIEYIKFPEKIDIPVWDVDIQQISNKSPLAFELLKCCAVLGPMPIPEYVLRDCLHAVAISGYDDVFEDVLDEITGFALLSEERSLPVETRQHKYYAMHSLVQHHIRVSSIGRSEMPVYISLVCRVLSRHLPSGDFIAQQMEIDQGPLGDLLPHINVLAKPIVQLSLVDDCSEFVFNVARTVAVLLKEPTLCRRLCAVGIERVEARGSVPEEVVSRHVDYAMWLAHTGDSETAQQVLHKALVFTQQMPPGPLLCRVFILQVTLALQHLFGSFANIQVNDWDVPNVVQGFCERLFDLAEYTLLGENVDGLLPQLRIAIVTSMQTLGLTSVQEVTRQFQNLGAKTMEQVFSNVTGQLELCGMCSFENLEERLRDVIPVLQKIWRESLRYRATRDTNLLSIRFWTSCAQYLYSTGQMEKAVKCLYHVLHIEMGCLPRNHVLIGKTRKQLADYCLRTGDKAKAFDHYWHALVIHLQSTPDSPVGAELLIGLATSCADFSPELAEEKFKEAIQLQERSDDTLHHIVALESIAQFYMSRGRYREALENAMISDEVALTQHGQVHLENFGWLACFSIYYVRLILLAGKCLQALGDYGSAVAHLEKAFDEMKFATANVKVVHVSHGRKVFVDIYMCIADCCFHEGKLSEALSNCRLAFQTCDLCQDVINKDDPIVIRTLALLASCHLAKSVEGCLSGDSFDSINFLAAVKTGESFQTSHCDHLRQLTTFFLRVGDEDGAERSLAASDAVATFLERSDALDDSDPGAPWETLTTGFVADDSNHCQSESNQLMTLLRRDERQPDASFQLSSLYTYSSLSDVHVQRTLFESHDRTDRKSVVVVDKEAPTAAADQPTAASSYSIQTLPMRDVCRYLAWSITPRLLVLPQDNM